MIGKANDLEHRLPKLTHTWINRQLARITRTITETTDKIFHYDSVNQLWTHLADFMVAYSPARRVNAHTLTTHHQGLDVRAGKTHH